MQFTIIEDYMHFCTCPMSCHYIIQCWSRKENRVCSHTPHFGSYCVFFTNLWHRSCRAILAGIIAPLKIIFGLELSFTAENTRTGKYLYEMLWLNLWHVMIETNTSLQYDTSQKKVRNLYSITSRESGSDLNNMRIEEINCL